MRRRVALLALSGMLAAHGGARPVAAGQSSSRWQRHDPGSSFTVDHTAWAGLLQRRVRPSRDGINRVAYAAMENEDRAVLDAYLSRLADTPVSALQRSAQLAFWVNLHNALAVRLVLRHYPTASIRDIGVTAGPPADGPWAKKLIHVEGQPLSLDDIANGILRSLWNDPRVNYAICCATLGAPNLAMTPLEPAMLDRQLDAAAIAYVNHPRGVSLPEGRLRVSSLYVWYQHDFGGSQRRVIKHLMAYAAPQLAMQLRGRSSIDEHGYDWQLNDAGTES
jgi:hypothetical protein